jgi:hypothetical protein
MFTFIEMNPAHPERGRVLILNIIIPRNCASHSEIL